MTDDVKYGVILADPPWSYRQFRDTANGAAKAVYECLDTRQIAAIPVGRFGHSKTVLALWATGPKMPDAIEVMSAWGFEFKTMIPWLKNSPSSSDLATGVGIWWQANAEYVLFGVRRNPGGFKNRRGNLGVLHGPREEPLIWKRISERALLASKMRQHSRKPDTLHEYLETFEGPYLELFARRERPGWMTMGLDTGWVLGPYGAKRLEEV